MKEGLKTEFLFFCLMSNRPGKSERRTPAERKEARKRTATNAKWFDAQKNSETRVRGRAVVYEHRRNLKMAADNHLGACTARLLEKPFFFWKFFSSRLRVFPSSLRFFRHHYLFAQCFYASRTTFAEMSLSLDQ